jgi:hypothetical protein
LIPRSTEQIKSVVFTTIPQTQVACQMAGSWWSKCRNRYWHVLLVTTWRAIATDSGSNAIHSGGSLAPPDGRNERQGLYRGQSRSPARLFIISSEKNDRH